MNWRCARKIGTYGCSEHFVNQRKSAHGIVLGVSERFRVMGNEILRAAKNDNPMGEGL
jgi:hypothetical protein